MNKTNSYILAFIRHLLSAIANASLYGMDHPQVNRLTSQAFDSLVKTLEERPDFSLVIIENELVIDGRPQDFSLFLDRFVQTLAARGIGHIRLLQGVTRQEVSDFIASISRQGADSAAGIISSRHFQLGQVDLMTTSGDGNGIEDDSAAAGGSPRSGVFVADTPRPKGPVVIPEMPAKEMARLMEIYEAVKSRNKLKITGIFDIVSDFVAAFRQEGQSLLVMAALRDADEYTFTHSTNVCILNIAQAISLGIDGQQLNDIGVAGMLHDIGKLFIPEELITKNTSLSNEEFRLMQSHPYKGARYLLDTPGVPRLAIVNAFEHHMRFNFTGYPKVPSHWRQNLCSQMTTISDIFDALRTKRSYRESLSLTKICDMMTEMIGIELHPSLSRNFLQILSLLKYDLTPPAPTTSSVSP
ncbi:MAG: HD domain-containing protein [Desulfuromonadales bacterium]|nr:HD domain-containing protein [Desulfuromonadales bacterium]